MTSCEVIEYFEFIRKIDSMIDRKIEDKQRLHALREKVTAGKIDGIPHANDVSDKVGNLTAKMLDLEEEINSLIDDFTNYRKEASEFAQKLPRKQYEVIHMNMINGFDLVRVSSRKKISYQWASELKKRAIENLCEIIIHSDLYEKYKKIFKNNDLVDNNLYQFN